MDPADLRVSPIFADLDDDALARLAALGREVRYAPGEAAAVEGTPAEAMFLLLEGEIQFRVESRPDSPIFEMEAGELSGLLPFSRMTHYTGTLRATRPTRAVVFAREDFPRILELPAVEQRLVAALTDRVRETTRYEQQREKLMALGKLSAGLAHEMNNPSSAIRRGVSHLRERLCAIPGITTRLAGCALDVGQLTALSTLLGRKMEEMRDEMLDPLAASDREEAIGEWLEARDVPEAWVLAETFVAAGVEPEELDALAARLPERALPDAIAWLGTGLSMDRLLREVDDASRRISELVASVKGYSHMDQGQARAVTDVHAGLESTLTMLAHKIRARNATVERDYARDLPHPLARPGELNQVWTNLLDNALDAIPADGSGRILVRTFRRDDMVVIEIHDNGPGVPDEIATRVWDPFFTTKDVGQGTGLGLDIVRRLIERSHAGIVSLATRPGDTCFQVRLPIAPPAPPAAGLPDDVAGHDEMIAGAS